MQFSIFLTRAKQLAALVVLASIGHSSYADSSYDAEGQRRAQSAGASLIGQPGPAAVLKTLDGETIDLSKLYGKKPVYLKFWATWCVPCIKELDAISDLYQDWIEETGVSLIAVSVDDSRTVKRVKSLINGKGWEYDILLDTNNDLKRALGASSIPLTIVVKDNKIVYRHSGYSPGAEYELYEKVKEYTSK